MALIQPFKGILYNTQKVIGDNVVAPPYDVITPGSREVLYDKSPYNIIRIDFGTELPGDSDTNNRYIRAKYNLRQWMETDILMRDEKPYFYAYESDYSAFGRNQKLRGIIALVRLDELGKGVYPHEATYSKPKADRLNLMKACYGNISPIYALYNSPERIASQILNTLADTPLISARDYDGADHKLYRIQDRSLYENIINEFSGKAIYIADGHHRYEVALEFKEEMRKADRIENNTSILQPYDYIMMFLANIQDDGISILPTHRLIKGISDSRQIISKIGAYFEVFTSEIENDIRKVLSGYGKNAIGMYVKKEEKWYILKYKGGDLQDIHPALKSLDVVLLHELIFKQSLGITDFAYEMNPTEALKMVRSGLYDVAFFLNPTEVDDVERSALANVRMPPKSTYFYPKILTGLIINSFNK